MAFLRGALVAALTVGVAAQSREPSQWDNYTVSCSVTSPTGATISAITQTTMDSVTVTYSNYGASGPTSLWLTNQDGTIIAYDENGLNGASKVLTFQAASLSEMPTDVTAYTCPPSTNFTLPKRMWRGIYEDATNNCCSDQLPTTQETTDYTATIAVATGNGAGSWGQQQFTFTTPKKSALMFAQDDSGRILHLVEHAAPITAGTYASGSIGISVMTKSVRACSMLTTTDVANQKNPICAERSMVSADAHASCGSLLPPPVAPSSCAALLLCRPPPMPPSSCASLLLRPSLSTPARSSPPLTAAPPARHPLPLSRRS